MSVFEASHYVHAARLAYADPGRGPQVPIPLRSAAKYDVDFQGASGKVFLDHEQRLLVVAIAGSSSMQHLVHDLSFQLESFGKMRVGSGVWEYCCKFTCALLELLQHYPNVRKIDPDTYRVILLGHSLGGSAAIALPFAVQHVLLKQYWGGLIDLDTAKAVRRCFQNPEIFTYGAMRVLHRSTAAAYPWRATHIEVEGDVAALWPPRLLGYCHPGSTVVLRKNGEIAKWAWTFRHIAAAIRAYFQNLNKANKISAHSCFTYESLLAPFSYNTLEYHLGLARLEDEVEGD